MASGRNSKHLTIAEKYDILEMREKCESRKSAIQKYGISRNTLSYIYVHSERIIEEYENSIILSSVTKRLPQRSVDVGRVVHQWYLRCKAKNEQVTEADIRRRALEFNTKLLGTPSFRAGPTWLRGFRERYNITNADIRKTVPAKTEAAAADAFRGHLSKLRSERQITWRNVYNVVYTKILWKILPEGTCVTNSAKSTESPEMYENYVTALFCVNATGCSKLPVLIIGTERDICALHKDEPITFSTIYISKDNACMDSTIFKEWYKDYFLKLVKERQRRCSREEQYLLLLDNAMSLHNLDDLNDLYRSVTVMSLPVNVSPLRQPINCDIMSCFMKKFRIALLKRLWPLTVFCWMGNMIEAHKNMAMWDCCQIVHDAWSLVDVETVTISWDSFLWVRKLQNVKRLDRWESDMQQALIIFSSLPGCQEIEEIDIYNWFSIENQYDTVKKKYADEVFREFKDNPPLNTDNIDDKAGPSRAKISKRS